ncbi:MAG TPA: hypothetical protein PK176_01970 [Acidobacteriota bacterium]|nr:hypothetical protein [Acidobacteriota bacterium]HQM62052.1 hypothetical protein [Acidobacteriota bacterium]
MARVCTVCILIAWCCQAACPAAATGQLERLRQDNDALRHRVETLERSLAEMRAIVDRLTDAVSMSGGERAAAAAAPAPPAPSAISLPVESPAPPLPPPLQIYGNVELDFAWDLDRNQLGEPEPDPLENTTFDLSPRPSRLGARFHLPGPAGSAVSGRVETDFVTASGTENSPNLRLRHAYAEIAWADSGFSLLGGQTYDIIAPLQTDTIDYPTEQWPGDVGYRRPLLRVRQTFGPDPARRFTLEGAVARITGVVEDGFTEPATSTVRMPAVQARAAGTWPLFGGRGSTFGVWGHYGSKQHHLSYAGDQVQLTSWSVGMDADIWLTPQFEIMSEFWRGVTMDTYYWSDQIEMPLGDTTFRSVDSTGGWATLTWRQSPALRFNLGAGFHDPADHKLDGAEEFTHVVSYFGNFFYDFDEHWEVGMEFSWWHAAQLDGPDRSKRRIGGTFLYRF